MDVFSRGDGKLGGRIASICFWVALWAVIAALVGNDILLAGPVATLKALATLLASLEFWSSVALSGARIVISSILSAIIGIILGLCAARWRALETLLEVPIQIMKSAPVACVVVVLLVAFGSVGAIVVIVAFVALPPFYFASLDASRVQVDDEYRVLELMGLSKPALFFACTWPSILPYYLHASKTAIALSWRAGITGELLSIPLGSIGAGIYLAKLTLDTPALLAWTGIIMILAFACEFIVLRLLALTTNSPRIAVRIGRGELPDSRDSIRTLRACVLSKRYSGKPVLSDFDIEIGPGQRICLMAPTGAGKTTLLRLVLGLEEPDSGDVQHPALCGVALQGSTLIECLDARENVSLVASARYPSEKLREELEALLPPGALGKSAGSLSGGTKRLTEIARAIFSPGVCIVLDEPFAGLDPESREAACSLIMRNLEGRPLIVATHEQGDAELLDAQIARL